MEMDLRQQSGKLAFVQQVHQRRLGIVIPMVSKSNCRTARFFCHVEQKRSSLPRAAVALKLSDDFCLSCYKGDVELFAKISQKRASDACPA
jgi:hypothetical protein